MYASQLKVGFRYIHCKSRKIVEIREFGMVPIDGAWLPSVNYRVVECPEGVTADRNMTFTVTKPEFAKRFEHSDEIDSRMVIDTWVCIGCDLAARTETYRMPRFKPLDPILEYVISTYTDAIVERRELCPICTKTILIKGSCPTCAKSLCKDFRP